MTLALRLLARRDRSEAEVGRVLETSGVPAPERQRVVERLRGLRYLDDRRFAAERAGVLASRGYGALRIRVDLERRGVSGEIVAECLAGLDGEAERAGAALEKRFGSARPEDRARAWRYLAGRGFSEDVIRDILGDETGDGC